MNRFTKKGFTLIELLVVIAIISVLSSIVLSQLNEARAKARDTRRVSDLKNIQLALELYRDDNGAYPDAPGPGGWAGTVSSLGTPKGNWMNRADSLGADLSLYIKIPPKDQLNTCVGTSGFPANDCYGYYYRDTDTNDAYDLITRFETDHQLSCKHQKNNSGFGAGVGYVTFAPDTGAPDTGVVNGPTVVGHSWCDNADPISDYQAYDDYLYVISSS